MQIAFPLYIDVPMMVSTLASLQDGVGVDGALASLGLDLEGRVGATAAPTAGNAIVQRHTVASLFSRTRAALGDHARRVEAPGDLARVTEGDFVEVSGPLVRSPIVDFVAVMERLFAISQATREAESAGFDMDVPEETRQVFHALRHELDTSPVIDATLRTRGGLTGVVELQKAYVRHVSLDDLRFGRVTVLGKCVGALADGERYSLVAKSLLGHMVSTAFTDALSGLQQVNPEEAFPMVVDVTGPAVLVVPMAVFV